MGKPVTVWVDAGDGRFVDRDAVLAEAFIGDRDALLAEHPSHASQREFRAAWEAERQSEAARKARWEAVSYQRSVRAHEADADRMIAAYKRRMAKKQWRESWALRQRIRQEMGRGFPGPSSSKEAA